jgi:alpha-tubulin suppressor-like RCC1 family protein
MEPPALVADVGIRWSRISAGHDFACATAQDGGLWCWGHNNAHQVGLGASAPDRVETPGQVMPGTQWSAVATGRAHACAIRRDGSLYCWGSNSSGQVGDGGSSDPVADIAPVGGSDRFRAVSAREDHTCAVRDDGTLFCWGAGGSGQLGLGGTDDGNVPTALDVGATRFVGVATGVDHTCAVADDSTTWCWGDNSDGELGLGESDRTARLVPTRLP